MNITIIGAGKMGEALARGILKAGLVRPEAMTLADVAADRLGVLGGELLVGTTTDNAVAVTGANLVVLAVKPALLAAVCREIGPACASGTVVLSIAAGITLATVREALGRDGLIPARAMPNTPCLVGAGAIGLCIDAPADVTARVCDVLAAVAIVEVVPEGLLDAVTGLSGSGPAYVALFIEALADGGVLMGLPRATALRLAAQTVYGTAKMLLETEQHPAEAKDSVASPGGTTIAGVAALERAGFRAAAIGAVEAATRRAKELR